MEEVAGGVHEMSLFAKKGRVFTSVVDPDSYWIRTYLEAFWIRIRIRNVNTGTGIGYKM